MQEHHAAYNENAADKITKHIPGTDANKAAKVWRGMQFTRPCNLFGRHVANTGDCAYAGPPLKMGLTLLGAQCVCSMMSASK